MKMRFRRKKIIITAGIQMKITLIFVFIALIGSVAATFAFNYFAMKELESIIWSTHIAVKDTGEIIGPLFIYINIIDFLFVFTLLAIASVWMIKKTTGPLFRMSKDIMKAANGDLSVEVALRQKDEFKETAAELNSMIINIRDRFKTVKEKHLEVSESLEELKRAAGNPDIAGSNYNKVLRNIKEFEEEIGFFQIKKTE